MIVTGVFSQNIEAAKCVAGVEFVEIASDRRVLQHVAEIGDWKAAAFIVAKAQGFQDTPGCGTPLAGGR